MNTESKFTDQAFDNELKRLFEKEVPASPSFHFTEEVMEKVRIEVKLQSYRPVISKLGWVIVAFFLLAVVVFALLAPGSSTTTPAWVTQATGFLSANKPNFEFLGGLNNLVNELNVSGLVLPLSGLLLAMGFHGLVMKRFFFQSKKNVPGALML